MKKLLYTSIGIFVLLIVGCKNTNNTSSYNEEQAKKDSVALALKADSIDRERKFAAKGDTVFGRVCYGMNKEQSKKAAKEFCEAFKDKSGYGFIFDTYDFHSIDYFKEIEEFSAYDLKHSSNNNRLFKGKLYSIEWESFRNYGKSGQEIANRLNHLIELFEVKYGKCNEKPLDLCNYFGQYISNKKVVVCGYVAKWETINRKIFIFVDELVGSDRGSESTNEPYQYRVSVHFINKEIEKEVDEYSERVYKENEDAQRQKQIADSIKMVNSL